MRQLGLPAPFYRAARLHVADPSPQATARLQAVTAWQALRTAGLTAQAAARQLQLPRATLFRWARRLAIDKMPGLEDRARRPHRLRQSTWSPLLVTAVQRLREENPRWGKVKLMLVLRTEGWEVSASMVGRILVSLRQQRRLSAPGRVVSAHKRRPARPYGVRKPKDYVPRLPGDLVQLDTVDLRPLPGVVLKQFTAIDVVSRWSVADVRTRATATTATEFLDTLQARLGFPLRALQVDGGSEFMAGFEQACQQRGIRLFVLPPRSPKLNGCVERVNRTYTEEFWECYDGDLDLPVARPALLAWQGRYHTVRPHQALGYQTPAAFLQAQFPALAAHLACNQPPSKTALAFQGRAAKLALTGLVS